MGYMRHHAIVVSASYGHWIEDAHAKAVELFLPGQVTDPTPEMVNGERSFLVAPDGSKEGWDASYAGDEGRADFVAWLREQAYEDGSSPLDWVEVQYGDENHETRVLADSDERRRQQAASREAGKQVNSTEVARVGRLDRQATPALPARLVFEEVSEDQTQSLCIEVAGASFEEALEDLRYELKGEGT